jgi:16S rRNA (adenine1518-N6/adenine1519-N6)-dimethyltransferase
VSPLPPPDHPETPERRRRADDPRTALRALGRRPRRALSQSFLVDPSKPPRIAAETIPDPSWSVLEIGPGTGVLTAPLAERARAVLAVEADPDLAAATAAAFADRPHVRIVHGDARETDFGRLPLERPFAVAGNIPYHLTGLLLQRVLDADPPPDRAVFTVQDEVARRIVAPPGSRDYGALTILVAAAWHARRAFRIPAGCFHPVPKVDSACVVFEPRTPPLRPRTAAGPFRTLVLGVFSHRRKTLRNALLAAGLDRDDLERLAGLPDVRLERRPEQHAPQAFAAIAERLARAAEPAP